MKRKITVWSVIGTLLRGVFNLAILAVGVYLVYQFATYAFNEAKGIAAAQVDDKSIRSVQVEIPQGSTTQEVAQVLKDKGLIESVLWFRGQSRLEGMDGQFKAGNYSLNTGMSETEIMEELVKGAISDEDMLTVTIPEGYTAQQIGETLADLGLFSAEEFRTAMNEANFEYDFLKDLPQRGAMLEGYLFPDTYFVAPDATPEDVISKMLSRFEEVYNEESKTKSVNFTVDEIVTRASIVEGEIRVPTERATCASVIQNRIDAGIPLQMDATVLYGLGEHKTRLLIADLEVDSPYNTYKRQGLPVGPICNPGRASLKAVLNPAQTKYIYYVVDNLEVGSHEFTETYDEFLAAKARYKDMQQ